ncbi:YgaP family membrane protein [Bacillus sp. DJP31]|uniref:YgaP family membrane protein n=1 Tax=Bacillus sp. DJP31 TaxID=3409789 RepID=UPI003BB795B9
MKPNIGIVNALIRLTCGFTMLAWATAKLSRRPHNESYLMIAMIAALKIGMGIVRFCPVTYAYHQFQEQQQLEQEQEHNTAFNPT